MLTSSIYTNSSALNYELQAHSAGCQCPGCCRAGSASIGPNANEQPGFDKNTEESDAANIRTGQDEASSSKEKNELSQSERQQIMQLQQRDSEVRSHEAAHIAAGGSAISGGASFTYQEGPDGKLYAIGGEVSINISSGNTPEETISIAKQVKAGALAPASPSPQDLKVAASASMMEARARQELSQEKLEELKETAINSYKENQEFQ